MVSPSYGVELAIKDEGIDVQTMWRLWLPVYLLSYRAYFFLLSGASYSAYLLYFSNFPLQLLLEQPHIILTQK